jgi:type II secretory pathway pseudopilin PulG
VLLKNEKKERGITLIALIVTVIILLILAGVTLFYVLGDNGIIKVAQDAKKQTEDAIKNEVKFLSNRLAPYKRPINIIVRTENLPRTTTRKLKRNEIKKILCDCVK